MCPMRSHSHGAPELRVPGTDQDADRAPERNDDDAWFVPVHGPHHVFEVKVDGWGWVLGKVAAIVGLSLAGAIMMVAVGFLVYRVLP